MSNLIVNSQNKLYIINSKALEFKDYIQFKDPEVRRICAETWGDGNGLEKSQAAQVTNAQFGATFKGNPDIESFDEFKYFTGITALTQTSNQGAFYNCTSLQSVYTPPSLHSLVGGGGVFRGCSSLEEVHFGGYISVGNTWYAFSGCSSLTKCYFENESDLWDSNFYTASNNTYCYQPFHVSGSGHYYIGDTEVTSLIVPKELTTINGSLFYNCKYITSLSFEAQSACTTISAYAFYGCSGIVGTVIIPPSVTNINASAFMGCTGITAITLPANVNLAGSALQNLASLETVTLNGTFTSGTNCFQSNTAVNTLNISSLNDYCASTINASNGVPTATTNNDVHVYDLQNNEITSIVIPNTMTSIASREFRHWAFVTSLTIPNSVTSIGIEAFGGCKSLLGSIDISNVTSLWNNAFTDCSSITSVILSNTTMSIASSFTRCSSLQSIYGLENKTLGNYCFDGCTSLSEIHVSSIESFLNNVYSGQVASPLYRSTAATRGLYINGNLITSITIPSSITSIGPFAFAYLNTIQTISIPNTVTEIKASAFRDCTALTGNFDFRGVTLGASAFEGCTGLTDITMSGFDVGSGQFIPPFRNAGNGTGTLTVYGDVKNGYAGNVNNRWGKFKHVIIKGDWETNSSYESNDSPCETIIIDGSYINNSTSPGPLYNDRNQSGSLKFLEIGGTYNSRLIMDNVDAATDIVIHFKYNGIAGTPAQGSASYARITNIYVDSQAVLDQYLADSDWSQYSDKLDLWSNYNGPYKA